MKLSRRYAEALVRGETQREVHTLKDCFKSARTYQSQGNLDHTRFYLEKTE
jgi:hypothetical protein